MNVVVNKGIYSGYNSLERWNKMFDEEKPIKQRCEGCEYCKRVYAQNNFRFNGCYHRPYTGKWVAEIKDCPKGSVEK